MQEPPFKHGLGIHGVTGSFGKVRFEELTQCDL